MFITLFVFNLHEQFLNIQELKINHLKENGFAFTSIVLVSTYKVVSRQYQIYSGS